MPESDSALIFDGDGDYVLIPDVDYSEVKDATIELWFSPAVTYNAGSSSREYLWHYHIDDDNRIGLNLCPSDGKMRLVLDRDGEPRQMITSNVNEWIEVSKDVIV